MSTEIKTFRDLVAWQKGIQLATDVYKTSSSMPDAEKFGLTAQMRRAAVSVASNIAEGYARQSLPDYIRFLRMARGSLAELQTQILIAERLTFLRTTAELNDTLSETDRVLQGLIRSLGRVQQDDRSAKGE